MTDGEQIEHLSLVMKASKEELADEIIRLRRKVRELEEQLAQDAAK
jgi:hypothetical protein